MQESNRVWQDEAIEILYWSYPFSWLSCRRLNWRHRAGSGASFSCVTVWSGVRQQQWQWRLQRPGWISVSVVPWRRTWFRIVDSREAKAAIKASTPLTDAIPSFEASISSHPAAAESVAATGAGIEKQNFRSMSSILFFGILTSDRGKLIFYWSFKYHSVKNSTTQDKK